MCMSNMAQWPGGIVIPPPASPAAAPIATAPQPAASAAPAAPAAPAAAMSTPGGGSAPGGTTGAGGVRAMIAAMQGPMSLLTNAGGTAGLTQPASATASSNTFG